MLFVVSVITSIYFHFNNKGTEQRSEIYGSWDFYELQDMGMLAQVRLIIEKDQITTTSTCFYEGKSVYVETTSPSNISGNKIFIMESSRAEKEYSPGFLKCKVSIDKNTLEYKVARGMLILDMLNNDQRLELSKSGKTFIHARKLKK